MANEQLGCHVCRCMCTSSCILLLFLLVSAGGLGALIHADRLRQRLPETVITLHLVVDGSLFLDVLDINGVPTMANLLHNMYSLHHAFSKQLIAKAYLKYI